MLLGGGKNKDGMRGRLLQSLEERVERGLREHVYLINNIHLVLANLWRDTHLVNQRSNIVDPVVRGRVQFMDIVRSLFVECYTRFACVARLVIGRWIQAVDCFRENTRTGGFTHATWSTEEVSVRELIPGNGILQCGRKCFLSHDGTERGGSVLSG